jgi:hypothetical protein
MFFSIQVLLAALWRLVSLVLPSKRVRGVRYGRVLRGNYFTDLALIGLVLTILAIVFGFHRSFGLVVILVIAAMVCAHGIDMWRKRQIRALGARNSLT